MRYAVHVKFNKDFIEVGQGEITVGIMSKPERGKANEEVIEKIAGYFDIPKSAVRIISGHTSKRKFVEVIF